MLLLLLLRKPDQGPNMSASRTVLGAVCSCLDNIAVSLCGSASTSDGAAAPVPIAASASAVEGQAAACVLAPSTDRPSWASAVPEALAAGKPPSVSSPLSS